MTQYIVTGMTCAACQARVEKAVNKVEGVRRVSVSLLTNSMGVEGDANEADVIRAVEEAGYGAKLKNSSDSKADKNKLSASQKLAAEEEALKDHETPKLVKRLAWSIGFLLILMYITMGHNMIDLPVPAFLEHNHLGLALTQMILAIIVMYINRAFFISGFRTLFHGSPNMDALVALGSSVSFDNFILLRFKRMFLPSGAVTHSDIFCKTIISVSSSLLLTGTASIAACNEV